MWSLTVVLLGCIVLGADAYKEELAKRISEAGDCIRMLVDCSYIYEHIAHNEINGSIFYDIKDLEKACETNKDYLKCVDRTKKFCEKRNMNEREATMIKRRLWMRDLCAPNSNWKKVYDKKGVCIIQESHRASKACSRTLTPPADPTSLTLDELCGFFVGMVKCLLEVLSKRCGRDASDLFVHISYYHGAGDYLCVDKEKRREWPTPRTDQQVFRTVQGLMANITPIIRATSTKEEAATILQDLNPQEVQKIKDAFKSGDGIVDEEGLEFEAKIPIHDEDDTFLNSEDLEYNQQATKEKAQNDDSEYPEQSLNSDELLQARPIDNTIEGNPEDHVDWSDPDTFQQSHHNLESDDQAESLLAEPDEPQVHSIDESEEVDHRSYMDSVKKKIWQDSKHEDDICEYVANFQPSVLSEPPESYKNCELDDFCSLENIAALYPKKSIQKRSLLLQEKNEASDSVDRNLSLVGFELPEHINDVEENLHQEMSEPSRKYQDPHCKMPESFDEEDSSTEHFTESAIPQEIYFPEYSDTIYSENDNIPNMINPTDCKTGSIQNIVSSTIKPGIYAEVTSLQTVHPPNFKFGKGCQFAENVNYIVVGEPYYPTASPLMASYTIPYEYEVKPSSGLLDAEQFIKHGIDSILTEPMGESIV